MLPLLFSLWDSALRSLVMNFVGRSRAYLMNDVEGQGLVEYALILVMVAVVVIVIMTLMGSSLGNVFSNIVCGVFDAQNRACL